MTLLNKQLKYLSNAKLLYTGLAFKSVGFDVKKAIIETKPVKNHFKINYLDKVYL